MANWLRGLSGKISDAIPNEFSQLNGFSRFLPPPFNYIIQAPAALDRFGETYSSGGGLADSGIYGAQAFAGQGGDQNKYGAGNSDGGFDWMGALSQVGNITGGVGGVGRSETPDLGSGNFIRGSAATDNPSTGGFGDSEFDPRKAFEAFQQFGSQYNEEQGSGYNPESQAELIRSRYPWIPDQTFQAWLQSNPVPERPQFATGMY